MASIRKQLPRVPRHTQRRGDDRRERLLRAAGELIEKHPLPELTYAGICRRARVPVGSAHHFYPDLDAIFRALLDKHQADKDRLLFKPMPRRHRHSWQRVVACLIDRAVRYHRAHPVAAKIALGGHTPPHIRLLVRDADRARAGLSLHLLGELFVVPRAADEERAAFLATEIVDTALTLSMLETGRISASYVRLAKAAAIGFLSMRFGAELPIRRAPSEGGAA